MIVTEEEAKEKWCQEVLLAHGERPSAHLHCIGPACMAWRWAVFSVYEGEPGKFTVLKELKTHGYCGKAGRP